MRVSFTRNSRAISCRVLLRELECDIHSERVRLERLLESRFKAERSAGGTIASATGHTALIAAALYATAQSNVEQRPAAEVVSIAYMPARQPVPVASPGRTGAVATFVVDEQRRAEQGSIRILRSDNELFERAVRAALRDMRFIPAEVGGQKVRQLVQMPFVFRLSR